MLKHELPVAGLAGLIPINRWHGCFDYVSTVVARNVASNATSPNAWYIAAVSLQFECHKVTVRKRSLD